MNDERVEAAAKWKAVAMYDGPQHDPKYWAVVDGDGRKVLDTLNADSRWTTDEQEQMAKKCVTALAAADAVDRERVVWYNGPGSGYVPVVDDWLRKTFAEDWPRQITIEACGEELVVRKGRG